MLLSLYCWTGRLVYQGGVPHCPSANASGWPPGPGRRGPGAGAVPSSPGETSAAPDGPGRHPHRNFWSKTPLRVYDVSREKRKADDATTFPHLHISAVPWTSCCRARDSPIPETVNAGTIAPLGGRRACFHRYAPVGQAPRQENRRTPLRFCQSLVSLSLPPGTTETHL